MSELETWLEAFPREEVERNIRQLEADLQRWKNALAIHDSLAVSSSNGTEAEAAEKPTKPQAITAILTEAGRPLKSGEIRTEMVERGWLPGDPKAKKRFYSTMTRLKGEGRIRHRPDGRYTLPEPREAVLERA